jgi:hypothetical protein
VEYFLEEVRRAARKRILYIEHALNEMNAEEEIISCDEIREVIFKGEIIEDYPKDKRGHSCLMFSYAPKGRPVHIVCSPKEVYLGIITAYIPTLDKWAQDFKTRRKSK